MNTTSDHLQVPEGGADAIWHPGRRTRPCEVCLLASQERERCLVFDAGPGSRPVAGPDDLTDGGAAWKPKRRPMAPLQEPPPGQLVGAQGRPFATASIHQAEARFPEPLATPPPWKRPSPGSWRPPANGCRGFPTLPSSQAEDRRRDTDHHSRFRHREHPALET